VIGAATQRRAFYASALALAGLAWALLLLWATSPWGRYLGHGDWTRAGIVGAFCAALPAGGALVPAGLYAGGWLLMLVAMMLPTALPVLWIVERMAGRRRMLVAAAGYLAAWLAFGVAAHLADALVAAGVRRSVWLTFNGWALAAAVLVAAGLFQFSDLKRRCLDRCRSPMGLVMAHWRGARPLREAFGLGLANGFFCVGCCWALMLTMFAVGTGNLAWMLLLGVVMAAEKNMPWGRRLGAPVGAALIAAGAGTVAVALA
jgi:predicted metal-binding membrane protein